MSIAAPLLNRRQLLQRTAGGVGSAALAALIASPARGLSTAGFSHVPAPLFKPRAKRVIFLFMNGGPSHVDTFDPKPALAKFAGQQPSGDLYKKSKGTGFMPSPLRFDKCGQSGIQVSQTLPHLQKVIDDCCIIRSMHTDVPNHEPALL